MSTPPGWYSDPTMAGTQRYWDGTAWTGHVAPQVAPAAAPQPASGSSDLLAVIGYVTAVFIPLIGFVIGCVLLTRRTMHAVVIMIVAVGATYYWYDQLLSSSV